MRKSDDSVPHLYMKTWEEYTDWKPFPIPPPKLEKLSNLRIVDKCTLRDVLGSQDVSICGYYLRFSYLEVGFVAEISMKVIHRRRALKRNLSDRVGEETMRRHGFRRNVPRPDPNGSSGTLNSTTESEVLSCYGLHQSTIGNWWPLGRSGA